MSAASSYHIHGFDEKKIETHVGYCKHLLDAAKVHCEAAEREEQQNRQRLEVARQVSLAEEARRKAEEQRKFQVISFRDYTIIIIILLSVWLGHWKSHPNMATPWVLIGKQLERRKQEDELKKVMQQEEHFLRIKVGSPIYFHI